MSEDNGNSGAFMLKRIGELERQLVEVTAEAKKRRLEKRSALKELEELRAEHETWAREREAAQASPGEWQAKAAEMQKQIWLRDHRDAWVAAIGETLGEKVTLEKVWAEINYEPGEHVPSPQEIKEQAKAARDAAPYLFHNGRETGTTAPGGAQQTPRGMLSVPLDVSRGDRDTGIGRMVVRASQMRDAGFMMSNTKALAEASQKGMLTVLPD